MQGGILRYYQPMASLQELQKGLVSFLGPVQTGQKQNESIRLGYYKYQVYHFSIKTEIIVRGLLAEVAGSVTTNVLW